MTAPLSSGAFAAARFGIAKAFCPLAEPVDLLSYQEKSRNLHTFGI